MKCGNSVLSQFSREMQPVVQEYCNRLNACTADIFIAMARKGVCFFDILKDDGLIELDQNQIMISSSALDFIAEFDKSKRIAVTDDVMISGTSVASVVNVLLDRGVPEENIEIIVLAADLDYMFLDFTGRLGESLLSYGWKLPNAECIELSSQISKVLSLFGRPYDVDFPVYDAVSVPCSLLSRVLNYQYWNIYNVTNLHHATSGIDVMTLIPQEKTVGDIWQYLGFNTEEFAHIKIRLYIKKLNANHVSVQLVPYVLFYEIKSEDVDQLFSILSSSNEKNIERFELSNKAKLRVCQFILCDKIAKYFISRSKIGIDLHYQEEIVTSLFGYSFADVVIQLMKNSINCESFKYKHADSHMDYLEYCELNSDNSLLNRSNNIPRVRIASEDGRELNLQLLEPFSYWYKNKELATRNELKTGYHYRIDRSLIDEKTLRLNSGFSFCVLSKLFEDPNGYYQWPDVISVFLDRAIDMGIIVPIVYENKDTGIMCRAFRHGEDLPFGVADRSRVYYFLERLQEGFVKNNCEGIAQISFEKILVLFIQMGIRDGGIFNRFLGFDNRDFLSIRYSVHGAIATKIDANHRSSTIDYYYDAADYWEWITNYLKKEGIIEVRERIDDNKRIPNTYISSIAIKSRESEYNYSNICDSIKSSISKYADLFTEWYAAMHLGRRDHFKDQVIQLSTCVSRSSVSVAIATEVHYFIRFWENNTKNVFNDYCNLNDGTVEEIRIESNLASQSLQSGIRKFRWFERDAYVSTIKEVEDILRERNSYMANDWSLKWKSIASFKPAESSSLVKNYYECFCYLLVCSACYELLRSGELSKASKDNISYDFFNRISDFENEFRALNTKNELGLEENLDIFRFVSSGIFEIIDARERINKLERKMKPILKCASRVIADIQRQVTQIDQSIVPIRYSGCVIVDLFCNDEAICSRVMQKSWDELPEEEHKTKLNMFRLKYSHEANSYNRYGVFCETFEEGQKLLYTIIHSVFLETQINCINTRFLFIPVLPSKGRFRYDYRLNLEEEIETFGSVICERACKLFDDYDFMCLLLIKESGSEICNELESYLPECYENDGTRLLTYGDLEWPTVIEYDEVKYVNRESNFERLDPLRSTENSNCRLIVTDTGATVGTATICKLDGTIYAITCEHCLSNDENCLYSIVLKNGNYRRLYGRRICMASEEKNVTLAQREVAVLSLFWDKSCESRAYIEDDVILSGDSFKIAVEPSILSCFGYPGDRGATLSMRPTGAANDGLYELSVENKERVLEGFSGSMLVDCDGNPYGIVYSELNDTRSNHVYAIPIEIAIKRAKALIRIDKERKNGIH